MKKSTQKTLALLLAVLMVTALLPVGVWAAENNWNIFIYDPKWPDTPLDELKWTVPVNQTVEFKLGAMSGIDEYAGEYYAVCPDTTIATARIVTKQDEATSSSYYALAVTGVAEGEATVTVHTTEGVGSKELAITVGEDAGGGGDVGGGSDYGLYDPQTLQPVATSLTMAVGDSMTLVVYSPSLQSPYTGEDVQAASTNPEAVQVDLSAPSITLTAVGVGTEVYVNVLVGEDIFSLEINVTEGGGGDVGGGYQVILSDTTGTEYTKDTPIEIKAGAKSVFYPYETSYADQVVYTAEAEDTAVAKASVSGSAVTIEGVAAGTTTVTVTAVDICSTTFNVTVTGGGEPVVAITKVTVEGTPKVGETLTAKVEPENATVKGYQWYNGFTPLDGATEATYYVGEDCVGWKINVAVTGADNRPVYSDSVTITDDEPTPPTPGTKEIKTVVINNVPPTVGKELTLTTNPTDVTATYQWYTVENDTETKIELAASATYTPKAEDVGKKIRVKLTGTGDYAGSSYSATTLQAVQAAENVKIIVNGIPVGENVTDYLNIITRATAAGGKIAPGTPEGIYAVENDTVSVTASLRQDCVYLYEVKNITVSGADAETVDQTPTNLWDNFVVLGKNTSFTKGEGNVNVTIVLEKVTGTDDPDLTAALKAVQQYAYRVQKVSDAPDAATALEVVKALVQERLTKNNVKNVTFEVTAGEYTAPAPDKDNPQIVNPGKFTFTLELTKGDETVATRRSMSMQIQAGTEDEPSEVMTLSPDALTVKAGETATSTLKIMGAEGTLTATSSDEAVATAVCSEITYDENDATGAGTSTITVTGKKAGTATITVTLTAGEASASVELKVTVTGGGSSPAPSRPSASTPSTTTEKTENPDGSVTTTVTDSKTGKVTETTKFEDGTTVETVTEPEKDTTVSVTLPKGTEKAVVTIPVKDVDYNTVLVDADGNVVKGAVPTENMDGIQVAVEGDAQLTLVKRSNEFVDVDGHWAEDSMNFTAAQELFKGVDDTHFAPDVALTRGMMVTILARFDGEDTDGGENWYDVGAQWAAENQISDGTNLPEVITREQLVTMLYRYAQLKGVVVTEEAAEPTDDKAADDKAAADEAADEAKTDEPEVSKMDAFTDVDAVSDWASDAVEWAVNTGILQGIPNAQLAPQMDASRAQVSTMLLRFCRTLLG